MAPNFILVILAGLIFALAGCERDPINSSVTRAIREIHQLQTAEAAYIARHGHYGQVWELPPNAIRGISLAESVGYRFELRASNSVYHITALHNLEDGIHYWSFYSDQTEVIRRNLGPSASQADRRIDWLPNPR